MPVIQHPPFMCNGRVEWIDEPIRAPMVWTEFESLADLMEASAPARYNRQSFYDSPARYVNKYVRDSRGRGRYVKSPIYDTKPSFSDWFARELDRHSEYSFGSFQTLRATNIALAEGRTQPATLELYESLRGTIDQEFLPGEQAISTRRRRSWNDEDGTPDPDRVNERQERFMVDSCRGRQMRTVRLGLNITQNAGGDESPYVKIAAQCAAAADHLERLGYSVQIVGICVVYHDGQITCHSWPLKLSTEPLDTTRVLSMAACGLHRWHIRDGLRKPGLGVALPDQAKERIGIDYMFGEDDRKWSGIWAAIQGLLSDGQDEEQPQADSSMDEAMAAAQKKPAEPEPEEPAPEEEALAPTDDPAEADAVIEQPGMDEQGEDGAATGEAAQSPDDATSEDATAPADEDQDEDAEAPESNPEPIEAGTLEPEEEPEAGTDPDVTSQDEDAEETSEEPGEEQGETPSDTEPTDEPEEDAEESEEPGDVDGDNSDDTGTEPAEDEEETEEDGAPGEEDPDAEEEGPVDEAAEPEPQPVELVDARHLIQMELDETLAAIEKSRERGEHENVAKLERDARAWKAVLDKIK